MTATIRPRQTARISIRLLLLLFLSLYLILALLPAATVLAQGTAGTQSGPGPSVPGPTATGPAATGPAAPGTTAPGTQGGPVHIIPIDGEITPAMAAFLENRITDANNAGAAGILIEIKTFGGRVDSAVQMRDAILASRTPVAVYIESRAISAGALISIAAQTIVMAPGSHIGAAQPIPNDAKITAYVSGEFRTTAERRGRDPKIAMGMVDAAVEIPGLKAKGEILDLTAIQAAQYGYADHIASGRSEALKALGWSGAPTVEVRPDFRFQIIQFLTTAEIASLLLTIGTLAIAIEIFSPGFGVPGIIGIICFALYFFGGYIAGYTDLWAVIIFFAGILLLMIELFVPGFGIFGIAGLALMLVGIIMAAPSVQQGVISLLFALVATLIAIPILIKVFGKTKFRRNLVLSHAESTELGYVHSQALTGLLGQDGVALTVLRPAGKVLIGGRRIDAITSGEFINAGAAVTVVRVEGTKVIVAASDPA